MRFMVCHPACRIRERRASHLNGHVVLSGHSPLLARLAACAASLKNAPESSTTTTVSAASMTLHVGVSSAALLDVSTTLASCYGAWEKGRRHWRHFPSVWLCGRSTAARLGAMSCWQ